MSLLLSQLGPPPVEVGLDDDGLVIVAPPQTTAIATVVFLHGDDLPSHPLDDGAWFANAIAQNFATTSATYEDVDFVSPPATTLAEEDALPILARFESSFAALAFHDDAGFRAPVHDDGFQPTTSISAPPSIAALSFNDDDELTFFPEKDDSFPLRASFAERSQKSQAAAFVDDPFIPVQIPDDDFVLLRSTIPTLITILTAIATDEPVFHHEDDNFLQLLRANLDFEVRRVDHRDVEVPPHLEEDVDAFRGLAAPWAEKIAALVVHHAGEAVVASLGDDGHLYLDLRPREHHFLARIDLEKTPGPSIIDEDAGPPLLLGRWGSALSKISFHEGDELPSSPAPRPSSGGGGSGNLRSLRRRPRPFPTIPPFAFETPLSPIPIFGFMQPTVTGLRREGPSGNLEATIERLRRLVALSGSENEHEATAASIQIAKLLREPQIVELLLAHMRSGWAPEKDADVLPLLLGSTTLPISQHATTQKQKKRSSIIGARKKDEKSETETWTSGAVGAAIGATVGGAIAGPPGALAGALLVILLQSRKNSP